MPKFKMALTLALVLIAGIAVQMVFIFADGREAPHKAAVEFAKAYFAHDGDALNARVCQSARVVDGVNTVNRHVSRVREGFNERGFGLNCYTRQSLYDVRTQTLMRNQTQARVRLTAERKSPLRSFFSGEKAQHVDVQIDLVREDGMWKVLHSSLPLGDA